MFGGIAGGLINGLGTPGSQVFGSAFGGGGQANIGGLADAHQQAMQQALLRQALAGIAAPVPEEPRDTGIKLGEVLAWRVWRVFEGYLYSLTMSEVEWAPGETMEAHKVGVVLGNGIHAFKTRKQAIEAADGDNAVVGRVALWGRVYEFEKGYHAEFGRVHSLDWCNRQTKDRRWWKKPEPSLLDRLRETYAV